MSKRSVTMLVISVAVCVLLALNLTRGAVAGQAHVVLVTPHVIAMQAEQAIGGSGTGGHTWRIFRLYSDGSVDVRAVRLWDGVNSTNYTSCEMDLECGPVFVVGPGNWMP